MLSVFLAQDGRAFSSEREMREYRATLRKLTELELLFLGLGPVKISHRFVREARCGTSITVASGETFPWKEKRMLPLGYVWHNPDNVSRLKDLVLQHLPEPAAARLSQRLICTDSAGREFIPGRALGRKSVVCYEDRRTRRLIQLDETCLNPAQQHQRGRF